MQAIETAVAMPPGTRPINEYSRNYARQPDGKVIAVYVIPHKPRPIEEDGGCEVMLEDLEARPCTDAELAEDKTFEEAVADAQGEAGQSRWFDDRLELPAVNGGGCGMVTIIYDPRAKRVESAECNGDA